MQLLSRFTDFLVADNAAPENRHDQYRRWPAQSKNEDGDNKRPPHNVVCITARVHPGENPASYLCHGLIELVISNDHPAKKCANASLSSSPPMLNPDGRRAYFWAFIDLLLYTFCGLDLNQGLWSGRGFGQWMGVFFSRLWCLCIQSHLSDKLKLTAEATHTQVQYDNDGMVRA